jgi:hypothetical protein
MKLLALGAIALLLATAGAAGAAPAASPNVAHTVAASGWAGGLHLNSSLAEAIARFGRPDSEKASPVSCAVSWSGLGLRATFGFGHIGHRLAGCAANAFAESFSGGRSWSAGSLHVGMPASAIAQHYPGAAHRAGPNGETLWYLAPRTGNGATLMTATTSALGAVIAVGVAGGSISGGFDVTWG